MRVQLKFRHVVVTTFVTISAALAPLLAKAAEDTFRPHSQNTVTVENLANYYKQNAPNLIRPDLNRNSLIGDAIPFFDSEFTKQITPYFVHPMVPQPGQPLAQAQTWGQDLFTADVDGIIKKYSAPNFLEAKKSFYAEQTLDPVTKQHTRPYYYLESWGELFHPPIQSIEPTKFAQFSDMFPQLPDNELAKHPYFQPEFQYALDDMSGTELSYGNQLKLLPNRQGYLEKLRLVNQAKNFLYIANMIIRCDPETNQIISRMITRKKNENIDFRVAVEQLYTTVLDVDKGCITRLRKAGIPVLEMGYWNKLSFGTNVDSYNRQGPGVMHHKFWIMDGQEMIIGGQNILDVENLSSGFNFLNRDTDLLIQGPATTDLLYGFVNMWNFYRQASEVPDVPEFTVTYINQLEELLRSERTLRRIRGRENYATWLSNPKTRMTGICRVVVQRPLPWDEVQQSIADLLTAIIDGAQKRIILGTADLDFEIDKLEESSDPSRRNDRLFYHLIQKSKQPGVKTFTISNGFSGPGEHGMMFRNNTLRAREAKNKLKYKLNRALWMKIAKHTSTKAQVMLQAFQAHGNIEAWQYFNYYHAKQNLFDGLLSVVGSYNLTFNPSARSHESIVACLDEKLATELKNQFTLDFINAIPVPPSARPFNAEPAQDAQ